MVLIGAPSLQYIQHLIRMEAEHFASDAARTREDLGLKKWAARTRTTQRGSRYVTLRLASGRLGRQQLDSLPGDSLPNSKPSSLLVAVRSHILSMWTNRVRGGGKTLARRMCQQRIASRAPPDHPARCGTLAISRITYKISVKRSLNNILDI
eukprot:418613-Prorocentrum_minimum.AAC.3